jgi:hypothetical protein
MPAGLSDMIWQIQKNGVPNKGEVVTDCITAAQRRLAWEDNGVPWVVIQNTFDVLWLPEAEVYRHLRSCKLSHAQIDERLELIACRRENLFDLLSKQPVTYIYPQSLQDAVLLNGRCRISGRQLLTNRDLTLESATLWRSLAMMLAAAGQYESLCFKWSGKPLYEFDIHIYETVGLCVTRAREDLFVERKETCQWSEIIDIPVNNADPQGLNFLKEATELLATEGVG